MAAAGNPVGESPTPRSHHRAGDHFPMTVRACPRIAARSAAAIVAALGVLAVPSAAHASFLPPELMDKAATGIAWFVIIVMPIVAIVLFWLVHVLPEKIAHKRHHPQQDAIHTL